MTGPELNLKTIAGAVLFAILPPLLAGCLEEVDGCGDMPEDAIVLRTGYHVREGDRLVFDFKCEAVERDHDIDRYSFHLSLARSGVVTIEPEPEDLDQGEVVYTVSADGTVHRPAGSSTDQAVGYQVVFRDWDPAHRDREEPTIGITWTDGDTGPLPGGLYGVRASLRSSEATTDWFVSPYPG